MKSSESSIVEAYMRAEAEKLAAAKPEAFVLELRAFVERIFLSSEDKNDGLCKALEMPSNITINPIEVDGTRCEWLSGTDINDDTRILYVHGGGALAGSIETHRALAARIADLTKSAVLTVDYRLAPEFPFPAGLEDCIKTSNWINHNSPSGDGSAEKIFMAGDSAGGGLILSMLANHQDQLERIPDAVCTFSALTDFTASSESMQKNHGKDVLLSAPAIIGCGLLYSGENDPAFKEISPLHSSLEGLPPLQMQVGSTEVLLDDSELFMKKHLANGGVGEAKVYKDMVHVWQGFAPYLPEANQALDDLANFFNRY